MTKKEILDYIIETPGNTNRAVLDGMLDGFEGGSGGGGAEPLIVSLTPTGENDAILSKTWQEIYDAMSQGRTAFIVSTNADDEFVANYPIIEASHAGSNYSVYFLMQGDEAARVQMFGCRSANEQPSALGGGGY